MGVPREVRKQNKTTFVWKQSLAWLAQGRGGGWAASRLVASLRRTPTIGQKLLRGKMVNPITTNSIKRSQPCTVNKEKQQQQQERIGKNTENREIDNKENREDKQRKIRKSRVKRENKSVRSEKACTNRLPTSIPLNSLLSSKLRI